MEDSGQQAPVGVVRVWDKQGIYPEIPVECKRDTGSKVLTCMLERFLAYHAAHPVADGRYRIATESGTFHAQHVPWFLLKLYQEGTTINVCVGDSFVVRIRRQALPHRPIDPSEADLDRDGFRILFPHKFDSISPPKNLSGSIFCAGRRYYASKPGRFTITYRWESFSNKEIGRMEIPVHVHAKTCCIAK